jgi:hypothetical protein
MLPKVSMVLVCVAVLACENKHAAEMRAAEERAARAEARAAEAEAELRVSKARAAQQAQPVLQPAPQVQPAPAARQAQPVLQPAPHEQELVNEEWVLPTRDVHRLSFTLSRDVPVHIAMTPVKHVEKGVTLRVIPPEDLDACMGRSQGSCRSLGSFDGFRVRTFSHTDTIPAGRWMFFVANTENILRTATVHVRVVVNASN